jgi:putative phage-type endonuclease
MLSDEQKLFRQSGIGSSEIGAVAGLSPYAGPMAIFLSKRGLVEPASFESEHLFWGSALEPVIRHRYERDRDVTVELVGTLRDREHDFVVGTPDGIVPHDCAIEIKTVGTRSREIFGAPGTGEIPPWYAAQCAWILRLVDLPRCDVPVLIGGNEYAVYHVERDLEFEAMLLETAREFWERHVLTGEPPPLDASDATRRYLDRRFPRATQALREANEVERRLLDRYRRIRDALDKLDAEKRTVEAELKAAIGEAAGVTGDFGTARWSEVAGAVSWKSVVEELAPPPELVEKHRGQRTRRLSVHPKRVP